MEFGSVEEETGLPSGSGWRTWFDLADRTSCPKRLKEEDDVALVMKNDAAYLEPSWRRKNEVACECGCWWGGRKRGRGEKREPAPH